MPVAESETDEPVQGAKCTHAYNLSAAERRLVSDTEVPNVFMTKSEVEAILITKLSKC